MQPLLITGDSDLLDRVQRLAAAAGVGLEVQHDAAAAIRLWSAAPLVLVGSDVVAALAAHAPPRRTEVLLVGRGEPDYRSAVALGVADVVGLPEGEPFVAAALADVGDGRARRAVTLGFVGGSGGVGATSVACATALLGAEAAATALLDLDPLGAGVERVVGVESDGVRWADLAESRGRLGSKALREALPRRGGLGVLGWGATVETPLDDAVVREVLAAAQRGHDLVVLDLPRHLTAAASAVTSRCDHVVFVAACTLTGATAALRALATWSPAVGSIELVGRTSGGAVSAPSLAGVLDLPLLTTLGEQRRLAEHVDLGLGPLHVKRAPVARAAGEILTRLVPA